MKPKNPRFLASLIASAIAVPSLHAATWTGTTDQNWNTTTNWNATPVNVNDIVNTSTGNFPVISVAPSFTPVDVIIADGGTNSGRLDHRVGSLSLLNVTNIGNWFFVAKSSNTATGTYNLADTATTGGGISGFAQGSGSLTVGKFFVGGGYYNNGGNGTANINTTGTITANSTQSFSGQGDASVALGVGSGASGTINMESGTLTAAGAIWVGNVGSGTINQTAGTINAAFIALARRNAAGNVGSGTLNVGGTVNTEGDLVVALGGNGAGGAVGTLNINAGGIVNVATATKRWLIVNQFDSVKGQLTVNGGTLNLNANTDLRFSTGGSTGASFVTLSNGGLINGGTGSIIDMNWGGGAAANNTLNLDSGTLTASQVISNNNDATAAFNFNGGTLKASAASANFLDLGGATQTAVVKSGGAVIDSNSFNVTSVQPLLDGGGSGGLTKNGAGTLTLSGANTYTGNTTVNAGQLTLADNANMKFVVGSVGTNTKITGTGAVQLDGDFTIDITGASTTLGDSWTLVDVGTLTETIGASFTVTGWIEALPGVWQSPTAPFRYTETTGVLEVVVADLDGDGLADAWEQQIIDANPSDGITTINHVLPGDDFDGDGYTNEAEAIASTDPVDPAYSPNNIDGDGLADDWETLYFGNLTHGPAEDLDGDLASNLLESASFTNPLNPASWPDTDTDAMNDGWETAFFTNLAKDGTVDTDGDGYTDLEEHDAHTNPAATGVSPIWATLKHRWSFNGDLTDSVGGSDATIIEVGANNVTQDATSVTLTGGAKAASDYVKLGSNLLPKSTTPVTIELWAKQNSIQNWSRIFDFHSGTAEYLMMAWTTGTNNATDRLEFNDNATSLYIDNKNQPYGIADEYHIVVTLEPLAGAGGKTKVSLYTATSGAADLGAAKAVAETPNTLINLNDTLDALGYSPWPDNTANATYNEARIWNGALFGWMREKLHDQGPDNASIPDADSDRMPDDWETQYAFNATTLAGDDDSDTFSNLDEYLAGTDPNNILVTPDDMDGDGLADAWEIQYFTNITAQNGSGDPDGDGLTNEQEETASSNPNDDEDGLLAAWENFFFGSTTTQNGTDDSDGDGVSNLDEHQVSQPNNILSTPTDINGDGIVDTLQHKLNVADALGSSSFNAGLNWNDLLAPAAGETYIDTVGDLRTPAVDGSYTFAGARLDLVEVYTGLPQLLIKGAGTVTFPLLTLNGGVIQHAATVNSACRVSGAVDVRGPIRSALSANNGPLAMDAVISGSGNLELWAAGSVALTAVNTYTGNIKVNGGGLVLDTSGSLKFVPGATGVNNSISGTGPVTLNGAFNIDLAGASSTIGDSWDLVTSTGTVTIGSTFTVTGFTADAGAVGSRIWTLGSYQFAEATGILSVSANPDADSDGMDDAWETTWFGGTAQNAGDDFDADGTNNLTEYRLGLVPNNGTSVFAATRNTGTGALTWPSKEGVTFRIERSDSLGAWTALETALPAAASPATTTTYTPPAFASDKAFYRVGLNP